MISRTSGTRTTVLSSETLSHPYFARLRQWRFKISRSGRTSGRAPTATATACVSAQVSGVWARKRGVARRS